MMKISPADCFVTVEGMELNEVPDGYVIYDNLNDKVHYLNSTAAIIYQMSDGKQTVRDVADFIKLAFDASEETDVHLSIEVMLNAGLICKTGS